MTEEDQPRQQGGSGDRDDDQGGQDDQGDQGGQNGSREGGVGQGQARSPESMSPEERVAALEAEKTESRERMLRVAAEFENYKKRVRKEMVEGESKAKEQVLRDLLEVVDNLERALAVDETSDVKSLQQGVSLVLRLFQSKLERYQVKAFESAGQPFDPRRHDAISQVPSPDVPPGAIVSEVQKGYTIGDRLLRPAMVVVAVGRPGASEAGGGANSGGSGTSGDGAG